MTAHKTAATATGSVEQWRVKHQHDDCPACREERYERAKADPVASVVLDAMHKQDSATYHGLSEDMGQVALDAAARIRAALNG